MCPQVWSPQGGRAVTCHDFEIVSKALLALSYTIVKHAIKCANPLIGRNSSMNKKWQPGEPSDPI